MVIFSSKIIPGNEKGIFALQNSLADQGIEIITEKDRDIHVSGHPCRDELKEMYDWARPLIAIPVHGERRHLLEHAKLAKTLQIKHALAPHNGEMIALSKSGAEIIDIVPSGRLHEDGGVIISAEDQSLRERRKSGLFRCRIHQHCYKPQGRDCRAAPSPGLMAFPTAKTANILMIY